MQDKLTPLEILVACFGISALGGFFSYLRSPEPFQCRYAIAATFYTGLGGTTIGLLWHNYFSPTNPLFLIGISGLAGLGGATALDILINLFKSGGVHITVESKEDD